MDLTSQSTPTEIAFNTDKHHQNHLILSHLKKHGSITQLEALRLYGVGRLASVIFRLKKAQHNIQTSYPEGRNSYARYIFIPPPIKGLCPCGKARNVLSYNQQGSLCCIQCGMNSLNLG